MSSPARNGSWSMTTRIAVILSAIGAALVIDAFIVALVIHPPMLGWVGFAIVSIIVLTLSALAPLAFERTRVSPQRPAVGLDREKIARSSRFALQ